MPTTLPQFAINDVESVDQNLQRFSEILNHLDSELGAVFAPKLRELSDRDPTDLPSLWQSLFDGIIPLTAEEPTGFGEDAEEEAVA